MLQFITKFHHQKLLLPVLCIAAFLLLLRINLITTWLNTHLRLETLATSQFQHAQSFHLRPEPLAFNPTNPSHFFNHPTEPRPNPYIKPLLKCPMKANNITHAIRLPHPIQNIHMTPPDIAPTEHQYFNPALIPLPPHSQHSYLLLSRLVTQGIHQESHICFATPCQPQHQSHSRPLAADSRICTANDLSILGPHGGLRCATPPRRLNIPPTPAGRCRGAWAAFPDIPGFHDPRVFWSGSGEPLVVVNSGSGYACVGLWVVDLRGVDGEVELALRRRGVGEDAEGGGRGGDKSMVVDGGEARMGYPWLTEITRSPRKSRSEVEKNWVLFFPVGDEAWVQYDLVARGGGNAHEQAGVAEDSIGIKEMQMKSNISDEHDPDRDYAAMSNKTRGVLDLESDLSRLAITADHEVNTDKTALNSSRVLRHTNHSKRQHHRPQLTPSRSIAKIIGSGYTTTNLTAADEAPCLTSIDLLDGRGDEGHWHQGSNSLRLILCSRQDIACLGDHDEEVLVQNGKVVHFAILHRKFSNNLDLPMRYERYIMVWEARYPFRMVGISKHPILFAGEKAQPWTVVENQLEDDAEAKRWEKVYFMYTPSLAWSWRRQNLMSDIGGAKAGPGTGYLGDEVMVGIGMDDTAQGFVKVKVEDLLGCLRLCPDLAGPR